MANSVSEKLAVWRACVPGTFEAVRFGRIAVPVRFGVTLAGVCRDAVPLQFCVERGGCDRLSFRHDSVRYHLADSVANHYDCLFPFRDFLNGDYSLARFIEGSGKYVAFHDANACRVSVAPGVFDAVADYPCGFSCSRFRVNIPTVDQLGNRYDVISAFSTMTLPGVHSVSVTGSNMRPGRFDAVFSVADLPERKAGRLAGRWWIVRHRYDTRPSLFVVCKGLSSDRRISLFDSVGTVISKRRFDWQNFVRPGWRLSARNIETQEVTEIGFIDADSETKKLCGVSLPDGEYELVVKHSSLFWKDARDRVVRRFSVRSGDNETYIPLMENLRASIRNGSTLIQWSSEFFADIVYGIWFSPNSPVDVAGPPDAVQPALDGVTEYIFERKQTGPEYVAVAALREERQGAAAEIFLDWNAAPPPRPGDQIVFETE